MRLDRWSVGSFFVLGLLACGGKAVMNPPGHGGGGGHTATTTGTGGTATTSGEAGAGAFGGQCDVLGQDLVEKIAEAIACDPYINMPQCIGEASVLDQCSCVLVANENNPAAVQAALDAYDVWVGQGCGPYLCAACPPVGPGGCVPEPNGGGTCQYLEPL